MPSRLLGHAEVAAGAHHISCRPTVRVKGGGVSAFEICRDAGLPPSLSNTAACAIADATGREPPIVLKRTHSGSGAAIPLQFTSVGRMLSGLLPRRPSISLLVHRHRRRKAAAVAVAAAKATAAAETAMASVYSGSPGGKQLQDASRPCSADTVRVGDTLEAQLPPRKARLRREAKSTADEAATPATQATADGQALSEIANVNGGRGKESKTSTKSRLLGMSSGVNERAGHINKSDVVVRGSAPRNGHRHGSSGLLALSAGHAVSNHGAPEQPQRPKLHDEGKEEVLVGAAAADALVGGASARRGMGRSGPGGGTSTTQWDDADALLASEASRLMRAGGGADFHKRYVAAVVWMSGDCEEKGFIVSGDG
jgi:hypothetical protein